MLEKAKSVQIDYIIELVLKHRWLFIIPFCLSMLIGIILIFLLPKVYEARAVILVRPQSVPSKFVQSLVTTDIESRVKTISRLILSRSNLEKIINQFNLYMSSEFKDMYPEDKVIDLRDRFDIHVETTDTSNRYIETASTFSVSFSWPDSKLVAPVVNFVAALFIDENRRVREEQATDTSIFLDDELEPMRRQLEEVEEKIREFRNKHMGELPEQLVNNLRTLDNLQLQLEKTKDSLRGANDKLIILNSQIKTNQNILIKPSDSNVVRDESDEVLSLTILKEQLSALQASYTEKHPDVIRLKKKIDDLNAKLASGEYQLATPETLTLSPNLDVNRARFYKEMMQRQTDQKLRRAELKMYIKNLKLEIQEITMKISDYQQRVENTPVHEQELLALQRDYDNLRKSHSYLVDRKLQASVAVNMEKKQKGEQFEIIESAYTPREPISPNLKLIFVLSLFLAPNIGFGLIFLKEYFDTSLKQRDDIERNLQIRVLATIPKIYNTKDFRKLKFRKVMTVFSLCIATCLFLGFVLLTFIGPETTVEFIRDYLISETI
jgi:polysaccharide chain length determinant protein (PEP-CTERM system associated)